MKKPLIGLAPMAGITDAPMRRLCVEQGAVYTCTEMVSAIGLICAKPGNETYRLLLETTPVEKYVGCQLFGKDPLVMGEAAARLTELKRFQSIDINMGCPARKVVSSGEGSALLKNPDLAFKIMTEIRRNTDLPVTVKTRLGYDRESMNALQIGEAAKEAGLLWICIHGRTREQQYSGIADWDAIGEIKARLNFPVMANGDVFTAENARDILARTGADGAFVGRGAMGNPWLFRQIRQMLSGEAVTPPTIRERIETAIQQTEWMIQYKGEHMGVLEMRKHIGHYVAGIRGATAIRRKVNLMSHADEVLALLHSLLEHADEEEIPLSEGPMDGTSQRDEGKDEV